MAQGNVDSLGMKVIRAWMWLVPIAMLAASFLFGYLAAADEKWGLLAVMTGMALMALALLTLHWWLLYRFGPRPEGSKPQPRSGAGRQP